MEDWEAKKEISVRFGAAVRRLNTMTVFCQEFGVTEEEAVRDYYYEDPEAPVNPERVKWLIDRSQHLESKLTRLLKERYEEDTSRDHLRKFAVKLLEQELDL